MSERIGNPSLFILAFAGAGIGIFTGYAGPSLVLYAIALYLDQLLLLVRTKQEKQRG